MSKTAAINIKSYSLDADKFNSVVEALINHGWSINKNGSVYFMISGSYDWHIAPVAEYAKIKEQITESIHYNLATCIDLIWEEKSYAIGIHYLSREGLMISISETIKHLDKVRVPDFSWYLERISPLFEVIEVKGVSCEFE